MINRGSSWLPKRLDSVTGEQITGANRNNPFLQLNTINPKSRFVPRQTTGGLDNLN